MKNFFTNENQKKYLSQAYQLEECSNPTLVRATIIIISLMVISFFVWAGATNVNEVARAAGEVVPYGSEQVVQHLEGGIVKSIRVQEGQIVEEGQTLLVLDEDGIKQDLERVSGRLSSLYLQEERLRAFIEAREPQWDTYTDVSSKLIEDQKSFFDGMLKSRQEERQIIKEQITQKRNSIETLRSDLKTAQGSHAIVKDLYDRRKNLNSRGYTSDFQMLETRQKLNNSEGEIRQINNRISTAEAEIREFENRLNSLDATHRDKAYERLDAVLMEKAQQSEMLDKLKNRYERLEVKAPKRGLVKGLSVNTVGSIVQSGTTLMEIVPLDESLVVHVKIPPQHIGHLQRGQKVHLKFSSYDFSRYGSIVGSLEHISATTFSGERGERYYQGHVVLDRNYVGQNSANKIMAGMTVMADIVTGEKTVLDYLLKPIHVSLKTSFSER